MTTGWLTPEDAAKYAGGLRREIIYKWLKQGLKHSKPSRKMVLIRPQDIDDFLGKFMIDNNDEADKINTIVEDVCKNLLQ